MSTASVSAPCASAAAGDLAKPGSLLDIVSRRHGAAPSQMKVDLSDEDLAAFDRGGGAQQRGWQMEIFR
jgi:hypothetical protein